MKRIVLPLLLGVLFLILQTTLFPSFPIYWLKPDILLIFTLYLGLSSPPIPGGILAFFMGYLMDLFSGNVLGLFTLSRVLVFYSAQFFKERFYLESFYSIFLFAFIFAILEGLFILFLMNTFHSVPLGGLYPLWFKYLLPQSFFTGLVTPFLFFLFRWGSSILFRELEKGVKEKG